MSDSKLLHLVDLAREPSSERRRELLREVTDLFFVAADPSQPSELTLFDEVLTQLSGEMEEAVRAELADRMADAAAPPATLLRRLANDVIGVSEPVLTRSPALSDEDLLAVAHSSGQDHLRAISRRADVSEVVSDAIVQ